MPRARGPPRHAASRAGASPALLPCLLASARAGRPSPRRSSSFSRAGSDSSSSSPRARVVLPLFSGSTSLLLPPAAGDDFLVGFAGLGRSGLSSASLSRHTGCSWVPWVGPPPSYAQYACVCGGMPAGTCRIPTLVRCHFAGCRRPVLPLTPAQYACVCGAMPTCEAMPARVCRMPAPSLQYACDVPYAGPSPWRSMPASVAICLRVRAVCRPPSLQYACDMPYAGPSPMRSMPANAARCLRVRAVCRPPVCSMPATCRMPALFPWRSMPANAAICLRVRAVCRPPICSMPAKCRMPALASAREGSRLARA